MDVPQMMQPAPNWGIQVSTAPEGAAGGPQIVPRAGQILQNPKTAPGSSGTPPHILGGGVDEPPASFGIVFGALVGAAPGSSPGPRAGTGSGVPRVLPGTGVAILGATGVTAARGSLLGAGVAILSHRYRDTGRLIVRHWYCDTEGLTVRHRYCDTEHPTVRHRYRDTEDPL